MKNNGQFIILALFVGFLLLIFSNNERQPRIEPYGVSDVIIESRESPVIEKSNRSMIGVIIGLVLSSFIFIVVLLFIFGSDLLKQTRLLSKRGKKKLSRTPNHSNFPDSL
jgi:hypothetical protein